MTGGSDVDVSIEIVGGMCESGWWPEESKVLEAKDVGSLFVLLLDFDVLARTHGKEKGKNGELRNSTLQLCQFPFCDFSNDAGGDDFLLLSLGPSFLKALN